MVWGAEVEFDAPFFLDFAVAVELGAVVGGDAFEHVRSTRDELVEAPIRDGIGAVFELSDQRQAGGTFNHCEDAVGARSGDGVDLPVAEFLP